MPPVPRAVFITIEGIDGAGKSTAVTFIQQWLSTQHIPSIATREPGGTHIGERIRHLFLESHTEPLCADTELLLMCAARAQHITQVIMPTLERGDWVVCDRFTDTTYAYQGGGRGIPMARIAHMEQWTQGLLHPDHILLLDIPPTLGMQRIHRRPADKDRIEQEQLSFFERVRQVYLGRAQAEPQKYTCIDASQSLLQVQKEIVGVLRGLVA